MCVFGEFFFLAKFSHNFIGHFAQCPVNCKIAKIAKSIDSRTIRNSGEEIKSLSLFLWLLLLWLLLSFSSLSSFFLLHPISLWFPLMKKEIKEEIMEKITKNINFRCWYASIRWARVKCHGVGGSWRSVGVCRREPERIQGQHLPPSPLAPLYSYQLALNECITIICI